MRVDHQHLFQIHGCARNKRPCLTAVPDEFFRTLVWEWKENQHYNCESAHQKHVFRSPMPRETWRAKAASVILRLILLIIFPLMRLIAVQATFQRVQSQTEFYIFKDNEAVSRMIMKGRRSNLRHVSRTQRAVPTWIGSCKGSIWTVLFRFDMCAPQTSWPTFWSLQFSGNIWFSCSTFLHHHNWMLTAAFHNSLVLQFLHESHTRYLMSTRPSATSKVQNNTHFEHSRLSSFAFQLHDLPSSFSILCCAAFFLIICCLLLR